MLELNTSFIQTITSTYGSKGTQWIENLPCLIEQCVQKWNLSEVKTISNLTYNYVAMAQQTGKPVVLKLRCDQEELAREVRALQVFFGHGAVTIVAHDYSLGALLLERISPGDSLASYFPTCQSKPRRSRDRDQEATEIAANLLRKLHQEPIPGDTIFPTLEDTLPKLDKDFPELASFLERARMLRKNLLATQSQKVLLHGDFHHDNILLGANNQWFAIDPEGIIGDHGYDMGLFIRSPLALLVNQPDAQTIISTRIKDFAKWCDYDVQRLYQWTYLQAISSAYWSLEDGLDAKNHCAFLELLEKNI